MRDTVGHYWNGLADGTDAHGKLRIHDPEDFVAVEIEAALRRGVRVIPLLVNGARMPQKTELPECLWSLARRQACELPDKGFIAHLNELIPMLNGAGNTPRVVDIDAPAASSSDCTRSETVRQIRQEIVSALSTRYPPLVRFKNSRGAMYWTADKSTRVVIPVSREYPAGNFWYAYQQYCDEFLAPAQRRDCSQKSGITKP